MAAAINSSSKPAPLKLVEKLIADLEELVKSLTSLKDDPDSEPVRDDNIDLQKFCAKLEFLLQFGLRERKNAGTESSTTSTSNRHEYWSMLQDIFKSSRSFDDAVKYVKSLGEIKTSLGKARAFLRFCLQYHRLADAIQQLTMEDHVVGSWYNDKSVWLNSHQKSRIIQLLYDLNDANFDLIGKNNFELDTSWPSIQISNRMGYNHNRKRRTSSVSSFISHSVTTNDQNDNQSLLLGSTPLQMDDDLIYANVVTDNSNLKEKMSHQDHDWREDSCSQYNSSYQHEGVEENERKNMELSALVNELREQLKSLNDQVTAKSQENSDLNSCLIKQTSLCENLSSLLKTSEEKNRNLEASLEKNSSKLERIKEENDNLKELLESVKSELEVKAAQEERLLKETLTQTQAIENLKQMCWSQEKTIEELQSDMKSIKNVGESQLEGQQNENKLLKLELRQKEEETRLLNEQIEKLNESLEEQRKQSIYLTAELNEIKLFYKQLNEKNTSLINQLEMDNNEIKKRLVKLIKEKADLWKKADDLEYENLLKTTSMWVDDSNVSNCMNCNAGFSLLLRKHHCRICLKVFCYYCCNNWIEYNNNKLRACKKCFESRESLNSLKMISILGSDQHSFKETSHIQSANSNKTPENACETTTEKTDEDDEDDDDPDVNFEVRPEKLNSTDQSTDDVFGNVYSHKNINSDPNLATTSANDDCFDFTKDETSNSSVERALAQASIEEPASISHPPQSIAHSTSILRAINQKLKLKLMKQQSPSVKRHSPTNLVNSSYFLPENSLDDSDTFAIVSQDEIDKIKT